MRQEPTHITSNPKAETVETEAEVVYLSETCVCGSKFEGRSHDIRTVGGVRIAHDRWVKSHSYCRAVEENSRFPIQTITPSGMPPDWPQEYKTFLDELDAMIRNGLASQTLRTVIEAEVDRRMNSVASTMVNELNARVDNAIRSHLMQSGMGGGVAGMGGGSSSTRVVDFSQETSVGQFSTWAAKYLADEMAKVGLSEGIAKIELKPKDPRPEAVKQAEAKAKRKAK